MNKKKRKTLIIFSSIFLCSVAINSENIQSDGLSVGTTENILETLTKKVVNEQIEEYKKFVKAGELQKLKVSWSTKKTEAEKEQEREENKIFQKYEREIEKANMDIRQNKYPEELLYYTYTLKPEDLKNGNGFNQIVASLKQERGTFASINEIASPNELKPGMKLILPLYQGLYIPETPSNDFEFLLAQEAQTELNNAAVIKEEEKKTQKATAKTTPKINEQKTDSQKNSEYKKTESIKKVAKTQKVQKVELNGKKYNYIPEKSMTTTAQAFFLSQKNDDSDKMILPLDRKMIITSPFGYRISPVTGTWKLHAGVDLAAPIGTPVKACMKGKVIEAATNHPIYGTYVIIRHDNKMTSTYAHLSKLTVKAKDDVRKGDQIGNVGTTGMSTGPHLHFEIREGGKPTDPTKFVGTK